MCLAFVPPDASFYFDGGFTLVAFAAALIVLATVEGCWRAVVPLQIPGLRSVGRVSYGIYLWHLPVFFAVARYCNDWPTWVEISFAMALTSFFVVTSWYVVEVPFLKRKYARAT